MATVDTTGEQHERPVDRVFRTVAEKLGCTEGQVWTLVVGTVLSVALIGFGIPPTLRDLVAPPAGRPAKIRTAAPAAKTSPAPRVVGVPVRLPRRDSGADRPLAVGRTTTTTVATTTTTTTTVVDFADDGALGDVELLARVGDPGAPSGVAVGPDGALYTVTDNNGTRGRAGASRVLPFGPRGTPRQALVVMGQADARDRGLTGVVLDGDGRVYALDGGRGLVLRFDAATGSQSTFATIPDLPACLPTPAPGACEPAPVSRPPLPYAAAFDAAGDLFVADANQAAVWKVTPSGAVSLWLVSPLFASVGLGLTGLQFDGEGQLVVALSSSAAATTGAVYVVGRQADGSPAEPQRLATTAPGEQPRGLALGASGKVYLAMHGPDVLLILHPDGTEATRVPAAPNDSPVPMEGPVGVAFRGRSIVLSNQAPESNDPQRWALLRMFVDEPGIPLHRPSA